MKKPNFGAAIAVFLIVGLLIPGVFIWAINKGMGVENDYSEYGQEVECRVCAVTNIGNNQSVRVKYKNDAGEWIEADCIPNKRVSIDQKLTGYVQPDDPYNVYCPPGTELKIMFFAIIGAVALIGWVPMVMALKDKSKYDKLMKHGVPCRAQLTSWHKEPAGIVGQFRIFTQNGEERIIDVTAEQGAPIVGEFYEMIFAESANGKITAALIDENLR